MEFLLCGQIPTCSAEACSYVPAENDLYEEIDITSLVSSISSAESGEFGEYSEDLYIHDSPAREDAQEDFEESYNAAIGQHWANGHYHSSLRFIHVARR